MALILNIDTSTKNCSVCLAEDGKVLALKEERDAFHHAKLLTSFITEVLQESNLSHSDLDAVAVCEGPGSYTGLRIGASVAKGLCFGQNIPLLAVGSLQALAYKMQFKHPQASFFVPIMDSRAGEIYLAVYSNKMQSTMPQRPINVNEIDSINIPINKTVVAGTGWEKVKSTQLSTAKTYDKDLYFSSLNISLCSIINFKNKAYKNLIYFEPLYLKSVFVKQSNSLPINE